MKTLIIFNHPYKGSYCSAILQSVINGLHKTGGEIDVLDLDFDGFNPVMTVDDLAAWRSGKTLDPKVSDYQQRIQAASHLVFIFPIWWEVMPAMTKGFLDKVLLRTFAYDQPTPGTPFKNLLLNLKSVTVITTSSVPGFFYRLIYKNAVKHVMLTGGFKKIGIKNSHWIALHNVNDVSEKKRKTWLSDIERRFSKLT